MLLQHPVSWFGVWFAENKLLQCPVARMYVYPCHSYWDWGRQCGILEPTALTWLAGKLQHKGGYGDEIRACDQFPLEIVSLICWPCVYSVWWQFFRCWRTFVRQVSISFSVVFVCVNQTVLLLTRRHFIYWIIDLIFWNRFAAGQTCLPGGSGRPGKPGFESCKA